MAEVTEAKLAANRTNAAKSTGPRTAAGKNVSRMNGLRHGLRAELVVVPQLEDASEWEAHRGAIRDSLAPATYLEELLADRAAIATWRMQRAARYERGIISDAQTHAEKKASDSLYLYDGREHTAVKTLEDAQRNVERYSDAIKTLKHLAKAKPNEELEAGYVFDTIQETAAHVAGIAFVTIGDGQDAYEDLPEDVYRYPEDAGDYPPYAELRRMLEAIDAHKEGESEDDVPTRTLRELEYREELARHNLAAIEAAIAEARDRNALPMGYSEYDHDKRRDEPLARYETAAEKTLERALAGLQVLRSGLGSVGKNDG